MENHRFFAEISRSLGKSKFELFNKVTCQSFFAVNLGTAECLFITPSAEQITGYPLPKLNPDFFTSIIHPNDRTRALRYFNRCIKPTVDLQLCLKAIDFRIRHAHGHWIWISLRGVVVSNDSATNNPFFLGCIHDITNRKSEEIALVNSLQSKTGKQPTHPADQTEVPQHPENLITPRETEVLSLIGKGFSSKEIAGMLFLSPHTVVKHRKNLLAKFGVKNTAQLICQASKQGCL